MGHNRRPLKMALGWLVLLGLCTGTSSGHAIQNGDAFDYVIVGCGIAGLVVSTRLSEINGTTVLCIENGNFDNGEDMITVPYYIGRQPHGFYNWELVTTPQTQLDGAVRSIPLGRGVGGGSLINGMVWNRGNQQTFDAWAELGNPGWAWADLFPYFRKSESFKPKMYPGQDIPSILQNSSVHGASGPVYVGYPNFFWTQSNNWFRALEALNIPISADPNDGLTAGGYFLPLNINPDSQTRHDARRAYFDPAQNRSNLVVQAGSHVTKVIFEQREILHAIAVNYSSGPDSNQTITVYARREVILAAGAIHSPQLLQLSGVGPNTVLQAQNLSVFLDLPGVGNNLQDHAMIHLNYPYTRPGLASVRSLDTNSSFNDQCAAEYHQSRTGPWTAVPSQAVAFPSLPQFVQNATYLLSLADSNSTEHLPTTYDSTLRLGYNQQLSNIVNALRSNETPVVEILNNNAGGLDLALQRPLSRGSCHINSTDPWNAPVIDPNWLSHQLDLQIMTEAMRLNDRLIQTAALQELEPTYMDVPPNATTLQLEEILKARIGTEYHQCGTAAMMPLESGGVVDSSLMVYGTDNLRVVDASIFPIIPAAHLQAVVFAVAEKAADIIKGIVPGPARK